MFYSIFMWIHVLLEVEYAQYCSKQVYVMKWHRYTSIYQRKQKGTGCALGTGNLL